MKLILTSLALSAAFSIFAIENAAEQASKLAQRVVPEIADQIIFEKIESPTDTFSVSARDGKILIEGNTPIAMSVGLNNYLRKYMGTNVSWFVDQPVEVSETVILPETPLTGNSVVPERFFLNYCTFGYTTPFWKWNDWERFIDWMALNGVNLPLAMTGQEKVWYETWRDLGLSEEQALSSFTGPAHLPWHWMGNVDHYQGPLTQKWLADNEELQKQILERERELGMKPVLPAFAGHVPKALMELYPDANITLRSDWGKFEDEDRCYFLDPSDPLYAQIQKKYLALQDSIYGTDHIYGIDPFNEVDSPDWSENFLRNASANIYKTLTEADPQAKWLQMTWNFYYDRKNWTKPRMEAFLDGVPGDGMILLDYFADSQPVWELNDAYFGKPYIWCYLGNFGGNTVLAGNLKDVNQKINDFLDNGGDNAIGIGGTLEGFDVNPVMHEFMLAKVWDPTLTPEKWIEIWSKSRGGMNDTAIQDAWKTLGEKVYVERSKIGQASLTNARPALRDKTGFYTNPAYIYQDEDLLQALDQLLAAGNGKDNAAYKFDVMNVTRQLLGNKFNQLRDQFTNAYENNNLDSVLLVGSQMNGLLLDLDRLMATDPDYSLVKWIELARSNGDTPEEKDAYETNARTLLTIWGYPGTQLNDYANRQWSGLLADFYRGRWIKFIDSVVTHMKNGQQFDQEVFREEIIPWEGEWAYSNNPVTPINKENPVDIAKEYRNKYFK